MRCACACVCMFRLYCRDGTIRRHRRESAPLQSVKPTRDETYRESIIRFTKFREHERVQRLSMGANDLSAYHMIGADASNSSSGNTTPTDQSHIAYHPNTCPSKSYYAQTIMMEDRNGTMPHNGSQKTTKNISVQFHLAESNTDVSSLDSDHHKIRHSMPASIMTNPYVRGIHRTQNSIDSTMIREEAIEEFEEAHCFYRSDSVNEEEQSSSRSPPMKFYKQNTNPYPSNSEPSSLSTFSSAAPPPPPPPPRGKCPEKPKRLLSHSIQSRKLLSEAHFTGQYRNFQFQSPYYTDSLSMTSTVENHKLNSIDTDNYVNGENLTQRTHYDVFVNKHGEKVEYALPCVDDILEYQRRQQLPNCLTSDHSILANEVFQEDPNECVRIFEENFETTSNTSTISIHEHIQDNNCRQNNGRVLITDLDKSTDSVNTLDTLDTMSRTERINNLNSEMRTPNRVYQFHETMQRADIICLINDVKSKGKMETKIETPLHFEWGTFKNTNVTVRKYAEFNDDANKDFTLIAETAIIRDAEVLR